MGQAKTREQLEIFIGAARMRGEALDHVLPFGPPGLGKTTLSHIIANELGVNLRSTSGPVLEKPKDLAALLTNLERNDVLFIDEIHRLSPVVEEILYPALEDYQIDIMIGEARRALDQAGPAALHAGGRHHPRGHADQSAARPLRHRRAAGVLHAEELTRIVHRSAGLLKAPIDAEGAIEIARRSRGTPRSPTGLRRVRDYADVKGTGRIDRALADKALAMLDVDPQGFDVMDRKLEAVIHRFDGGPVGLDNVAASIGEERDTIEDVIEPYLIQQGYLQRTPRGRSPRSRPTAISASRRRARGRPVRSGMIPMRLRLPPARWLLALLGLGVAVVALAAWLLRGTPSEAAAAHYAPLVRTLQFSARVATLSRVEVGSTVTARRPGAGARGRPGARRPAAGEAELEELHARRWPRRSRRRSRPRQP